MRALILAAGRGARLRPLTDDRPKCLVRLAGRALLDWQLAALRAGGIDEVAVVLGWRRRRVRRAGLARFVNDAWPHTNMVASLLAARAWLAAGPCLVAYGDVVYDAAIVGRLAAATDDIAISYDVAWRPLWEARFARPEDDAESLRVAAGRVQAIGGRLAEGGAIDGQFMGLLRLAPHGLATIEAWLAAQDPVTAARLETTELLSALVAVGVPVGAIPVRGGWCEVDRPEDIALYESRLAGRERWEHDWRPGGPCA